MRRADRVPYGDGRSHQLKSLTLCGSIGIDSTGAMLSPELNRDIWRMISIPSGDRHVYRDGNVRRHCGMFADAPLNPACVALVGPLQVILQCDPHSPVFTC